MKQNGVGTERDRRKGQGLRVGQSWRRSVVERYAPPSDWQPPAHSLVLCATPRAGSNYLAHMLRFSGDAGSCNEIFRRADEEGCPPRREVPAWMASIRDRATTANGVFSAKYFPAHLATLRRILGLDPADWFPRTRYIHLRRHDLLGQAISLHLAISGGAWTSHHRPRTTPVYDFARLLKLLDYLAEWNAFWCRWFALHEVAPLELSYEQLERNPLDVLNRVRSLAELPPLQSGTLPDPRVEVQRNEINATMRAQLKADLQERGYRLEDRPRRLRPGLAALRTLLRDGLWSRPFGPGRG